MLSGPIRAAIFGIFSSGKMCLRPNRPERRRKLPQKAPLPQSALYMTLFVGWGRVLHCFVRCRCARTRGSQARCRRGCLAQREPCHAFRAVFFVDVFKINGKDMRGLLILLRRARRLARTEAVYKFHAAPCCLCCRRVCEFALRALTTTRIMRCGGQIAFICGGGGQRRAGGRGRGWGSPGPARLRGGSVRPPYHFLRSYTSRHRVVGTKGMGGGGQRRGVRLCIPELCSC